MKVDARGLKHPRPIEMLRDHMRSHCSKKIDVELLLDSTEQARTAAAYARMSKCRARMKRTREHFVLSIKGAMCSCA